ncbi:MAG: hypothetical protein HGB26_07385 [Desulfobulbaceae bacterium]|nr:hypothetical protein [Desulfobulbaceae bacterium]
MKKFFSVTAIVGVVMIAAIGASAAPETGTQGQQGPGVTAGQPAPNESQRISGINDKRMITPDMNVRERMEVQRALQKRAAAKRNQLLLEAADQGEPTTGAASPASGIQ